MATATNAAELSNALASGTMTVGEIQALIKNLVGVEFTDWTNKAGTSTERKILLSGGGTRSAMLGVKQVEAVVASLPAILDYFALEVPSGILEQLVS